MTETTLGVLITKSSSPRAGSVGQIVPGMMAKIIDENGTALGPYQEGELCFKGPLIMKGYVGDEASTKIAIDKDNWLHTGDVAYYDGDGYFFIVDRIKELIKYKAFQVAPAELEGILLTHPGISDAAVVGLPDEEAGELPLAFVVRRPGTSITAKEVQDFVAAKVSPQKKLRGGVQFVDAIPKNPTGKILRRVLKLVGLPDEEAGELPLAFVVRRPGTSITAKEVQDFVAAKVSPQKKLRGGVQFVDTIPKNPTGKILRRVLKERV
ncbi:AMP-binding protein, partial [Oryctes borbonicus]